MYGAITRLITYKNIRKNTRRPVKCTAVRARVELYCAWLLGSLQPLDARHGTLTFSIRISPLELWKQPQNNLIIPTTQFTEWIVFSHYIMYTVLPSFCPYVACCCLKQSPNFFQFERNVVPVNVTFNLLNSHCSANALSSDECALLSLLCHRCRLPHCCLIGSRFL